MKSIKRNILKLISIICLLAILIYSQQVTNSNIEYKNKQQTGIPLIQVTNNGYRPDGSMDLTFAKQAEQKNEFIQILGQVEPGTSFLDHLFQTEGDDNFLFMLPVDQQVAFHMAAYVSEQNTFVRIKNVQEEAPIRLAVFQDNTMIIKTSFYFQKYIVFNGIRDKQYTIKLQTTGKVKLIVLSLKLFVQTADIDHTLSKDHANSYKLTTKKLKSQISQIINQFGVYWLLDQGNMKVAIYKIRQFYFFELFELLIFIIVSIVQIKTLLKLLKGNSIV